MEQNKAEKSDGAGMDSKGVNSRGQRGPSEKVTLEEVKKVRVLHIWGKIVKSEVLTNAKVLRSEHAWLLGEHMESEGLDRRE